MNEATETKSIIFERLPTKINTSVLRRGLEILEVFILLDESKRKLFERALKDLFDDKKPI